MRCAVVSTRVAGVRLTSVRSVKGLIRCSERIALVFVILAFKGILVLVE